MKKGLLSAQLFVGDEGQAAVFLLIATSMIMAFACGLYITSSYLTAKIQAQNAADAAAVAGSGALADVLDILTLSNWIKTSSYLSRSLGSALRTAVSGATTVCRHGAPAFATARIVEIGWKNGVVAVPTNMPNLEVDYRQPDFLGITIPFSPKLFHDRLRPGRIGRRYVRVGTALSPKVPDLIREPFSRELLRGMPYVGAAAEGSVSGWGLAIPNFKGKLGKVREDPRKLIQDYLDAKPW